MQIVSWWKQVSIVGCFFLKPPSPENKRWTKSKTLIYTLNIQSLMTSPNAFVLIKTNILFNKISSWDVRHHGSSSCLTSLFLVRAPSFSALTIAIQQKRKSTPHKREFASNGLSRAYAERIDIGGRKNKILIYDNDWRTRVKIRSATNCAWSALSSSTQLL